MASDATAPACIHRYVYPELGYVWVSNDCGKAMRVKVVINYGPDSPCYLMPKGSVFDYYWWIGRYDKTVVC